MTEPSSSYSLSFSQHNWWNSYTPLYSIQLCYKHIYIYIIYLLFRYKYSHEHNRFWRKNRNTFSGISYCVGTDLNRNWNYHWGEKGSSDSTCSETYRGIKAASEPETQAMARFIMRNPSVYKVSCAILISNDRSFNW